MEIKYREMNSFEKFMEKMKDAEAQGKRIESVAFTQEEYDEFRALASEGLNTQEQMNLSNRSKVFGVAISVSEPVPEVKVERVTKKK